MLLSYDLTWLLFHCIDDIYLKIIQSEDLLHAYVYSGSLVFVLFVVLGIESRGSHILLNKVCALPLSYSPISNIFSYENFVKIAPNENSISV